MIEFGGVTYYIDLIAMDKAITPIGAKDNDKIITIEKRLVTDKDGSTSKEELETTIPRNKEIDGPKFEILRLMLDIVLDYDEEIDATLGVERALEKTPISFKLAFNTLYKYGIIKEK